MNALFRTHVLVRRAAGALALLLLAGSACSSSASHPAARRRSNVTSTTVAKGPTTTLSEEAAHEREEAEEAKNRILPHVRLYFVHGKTLGVASRAVQAVNSEEVVRELVLGPIAAERALGLSTAIPAGTKLNGVHITNTTATVDLGAGFTSGDTSAATMRLRVAEVVYTVTQLVYVQRVAFAIDGKLVQTLGSDHFQVDPPLSRFDLTQALDTVLSEVPAPDDLVKSPMHVFGMSDTFEAKVNFRLRDANGHVLAAISTVATSGNGVWGKYEADITFAKPATATGTLEVFDASQGDNARTHGATIPVRFR